MKMPEWHEQNIAPEVWDDVNGLKSYKEDLVFDINLTAHIFDNADMYQAVKEVDERLLELTGDKRQLELTF